MKKKLDEYVLEKFDNKEISDMEMSDEESTSTTTVNNSNNNHTSASQKPTMPPRPSQGGSIKTHLDPRQSRKTSSSSNMNDSKSKQTSSSASSSSQQKTSPSGGQKRKSEAEDESMGKNSRTSKDDPFDFLSKLINKSASMQSSNIPSSGSGGAEATTNPNLSFLVSSLQKFVNSGSSSTGNPSTG